jgi:polyhydroxybutyrate depolymerase
MKPKGSSYFCLPCPRKRSFNPLCARDSADISGKLRVGAQDLHVPPSYDKAEPAPLVLALHGRLGTGRGEERLAHFDKVSDEHGFLVVYPYRRDRSWADGRGASPSDKKKINDVKFLSQLIETVAGQYSISRGRVYVTGMSNGGFMSARLACELSKVIAAVAIARASLSVPINSTCKSTVPV